VIARERPTKYTDVLDCNTRFREWAVVTGMRVFGRLSNLGFHLLFALSRLIR
jgi:hypothetical protein